MKKKNVTIYYGLCSAVYSIGYVTMSAFSSVFLLDAGFSNSNVGILLAIGALLAVLVEPVVGELIDNSPKVSARRFMLLVSVIVVILGIVISLLADRSIVVNSILYGMAIFLLMLAQPFINALGMDAINYGYPINFGVARSMGSLGYAAGSYVFGIITVMVEPKCVPIAFAIAFCVLCILLYIYPIDTASYKPLETTNDKNQFENPLLFLKKYKRFGVMLVGLVLLYCSHCLINTFALQIVVPKGGTSADMGTASSIAAVCELITTLLFSLYLRKIKLHHIIKISCIFFILKIFFSYLVTSVGGFFLIQGFQMFGWGFFAIGIVYYVNNLVENRDKAKGQAYAGMAYTVSSVISNLVGGRIIDKYGIDTMLIIGTIAAIVGTVIIWTTASEK